MSSKNSLEIEVWSDIVCPFCYIGKRNLETALKQLGDDTEVKIVFRSFELDQKAQKSQTQSIYEMLAKKYGRTIEWAKQANVQMTQTAKAAGLTFNMDQVKPTNSFDAHRLSHLAEKNHKQDEVMVNLFAAYFAEGKDIADPQVLKAIGTSAGLKEEDISSMLASSQFEPEVRKDEAAASDIGISGVPFFLFNRKLAVSGAQPPEVFLEAISQL